jgi:hypothetical protein
MPARGELSTRDLPSVAAFCLLFIVPVLAAALTDAILISLDPSHWSDQATWFALLTPPPLVSGGASWVICSRMCVERSTARSMTFAAGLIALALALMVAFGLLAAGD